MQCIDCEFSCDLWLTMKQHYREQHPEVNPHEYFTKEAKAKNDI